MKTKHNSQTSSGKNIPVLWKQVIILVTSKFSRSIASQTHRALLSDQLPCFTHTCTYLVFHVFYCLLPPSHPMTMNMVSSACHLQLLLVPGQTAPEDNLGHISTCRVYGQTCAWAPRLDCPYCLHECSSSGWCPRQASRLTTRKAQEQGRNWLFPSDSVETSTSRHGSAN